MVIRMMHVLPVLNYKKMIKNIESLLTSVERSLETLMNRAHDDGHVHDYEIPSGTLSVDGVKYNVVVSLQQNVITQGHDILQFESLNFN